MISIDTYIVEKLRINKNTEANTEIDKAFEIIKDMLDESQYKYDIDIEENSIKVVFQEYLKGQEHIKLLGYINKELRFNKIKISGTCGKTAREGNKPGRQWYRFSEQDA